MSIGVGQVGFSPDLGFLPFSDHFEASKNSLLVVVEVGDLTAAGATDPDYKGPEQLTIRIGATIYTIPTDVWRRFRPGRKKIVYWKEGSGLEGNFRFYPEAPPVF